MYSPKSLQQRHKEYNCCPGCKNRNVSTIPVNFDADGNCCDSTGKPIQETIMLRVCSCGFRYQDRSYGNYIEFKTGSSGFPTTH